MKELQLRSMNTWANAHMETMSMLLGKMGRCGINLGIAGTLRKFQMVACGPSELVALVLA